jgi:DedD protein
MRTLFDIEEEEEVQGKASEITLSTASLLGIFFGLVLICGVFFGFGYSLGRGAGWGAQEKMAESAAAVKEDASAALNALTPSPSQDPVTQPAPRAHVNSTPSAAPKASVPPPAQSDTNDATVNESAVNQGTAKREPLEDENPPQSANAASQKPAPGKVNVPAYTAPMDTPPLSDGKPMVQIAAVARPEDAYTLISALRKHGYGAVMRSDPQDKLVHVQVGPFADRNQATAVKQKLLADGYNAIIKQ